MLSKEELKQYNFDFWTDFKKIMSGIKSSNGKKINWLSYPTEMKHVYLRLKADKKFASLVLDFQHKDDGVRSVFWEQMLELKKVLTDHMQTEGNWLENCSSDEFLNFNRIEWRLDYVNYLNKEDENAIHDFLKTKLIQFDVFFQEFKDILLFLAK
jgi:hypothetical protein